jgi:Ca2+-binding EF-hand superfamily protein
MKTAFLTLCLLSATLITGTVSAQTEMVPTDDKAAPAAGAGMNHPKRQELLKKYDKNGDGKIDDDELADARAYMRKDGGESATRMERQKKLLKEFDKNGDGKLDDAERAQAEKAIQQFRERAEKRRAEIVKRFDKDGDGELNEAERAEAEKAHAALMKEYEQVRDARREKKPGKK